MLYKTTLAAVAAAVLIAGCSSAKDADIDFAPSATPTPTQSADEASECPNPHGGTCLGKLEPGTYHTSTFEPGIAYTVPAGWTNFEDLPGNFWLFQQEDSQDGVVGGSYLGIYQNVHAAAINYEKLIEQLAKAIHDRYVARQSRATVTRSATKAWSDLDEDLRAASQTQARDIPAKLETVGYSIAPGPGEITAFSNGARSVSA